MKKLFSCLLIIDDFAEDKTFMRYSKILHGLYTKSRHFGLSVITATQKYNALAPIVRLISSSLYIFKLKNMAEVDAFVQEQSALVNSYIMSFGKFTYDNTFNKPFYWVDEFLLNNCTVSFSHCADKLQMYRRYKEYAIKHNKGKLTLEEFHNEIMKQSSIEYTTVKGIECYTNCLYEPIDPNDDDFYRYENSITSTNR